MMKFAALSIASISALAASAAFAQVQNSAPTAPAGAAPAATAPAPVAAQPGTATDPSAAAPGAATPTAQAAPANANAQVAAVVEAGFPKYDTNKDGQLSAAEFKQWISDLKTQEIAAQGKPADPAAVSQYASAALAAADKDKDGVVTKQDLTTFLGG